MLDFALRVAANSHEVNDADFDTLHAHGFADKDIWDIAGIRPNDEFYLLGRVGKDEALV